MNRGVKFLWELLACALSLLIVIPLYFIVVNSFKNKAEAAEMSLALPKQWFILDNYSQMVEIGGVLMGLWNSTIITVSTVLLLIILSAMTAFTLQRKNTAMSGFLYVLILLGLMVPLQIIPAYFITYYLSIKTYAAAIIMLVVTNLSFGVFLYTGFFKSIPREIDEAAVIDGAGPLRLFFSVIFPLIRPVTVTLIIITFMNAWNDFGITIYFLNNPSNYTVTLTIFNFMGTYSSDWHLIFSNVVLVSLPVVIVYLVLQKHIIDGMTAGSVKG
ncbi:carbohydrate ABC transporter permease [Paenibacillus sp. J5C_2022]|uniref:carbohydrate ABC transporter permease n=1 Tax=Paenibacillus sp. J5C2022 TaxID=2977129 RepID=UPI0021CF48FF|nr:carbohydrate ABC transporter permease [Paenibacillus sp. J5C2022]MCU6707855.1 carbohydrate ABC transporter permease [Paenibacillus sp. J5C2022]